MHQFLCAARCGDGFVHEGVEECDDGNALNDDDCLIGCVVATCGDGFVHQVDEACDDGNDRDEDECTNACTVAACGDGWVQEGAEACDDGNTSNTDNCLNDCTTPRCGDGFIWLDREGCDDGNQVPGDGCGVRCQTEAQPGRVDAGYSHACRLDSEGAWPVGDVARYGQLGVGPTEGAATPAVEALGSLTQFLRRGSTYMCPRRRRGRFCVLVATIWVNSVWDATTNSPCRNRCCYLREPKVLLVVKITPVRSWRMGMRSAGGTTIEASLVTPIQATPRWSAGPRSRY